MKTYRKVFATTFFFIGLFIFTGSSNVSRTPCAYGIPDCYAGAAMFDAEQAMEHITNLAHNHLEGRLTGSYGGELAGNYIADRFAEYGLEPVIRGGSYFQEFTSTVTHNTVQPVLRIIGDDPFSSYNYDAHDEFIPRTIRYLGSGEVTAEVVWLGACEPSDFSSYRVEGKIVLCAPLSGPEEQDAFAAAEQADVGGLLIITEDDGPYPRSAYGTGELKYFPAYRVPRAFIYDLLSDTPYRWWDFFWGRTFTPRPGSYPALIETTVRMVNQFERTDEHARNVLGLLPGCDSAYDDEFVIVGAHYDHIGVDPDGTIYNGANDNASGVAVMLEIARLWADQGYCPDRSVLFAAWDAEEQWLVGSTHYVNEHPVFPLDQTIAYLNLDMVGVGPQVHIHGLETDAVRAQLQSSAETFGVSQLIITPDNEGDDKPFAQAGIPSAWLAMQMDGEKYYYPQYHRPDDDPGIIELDSLQTSGRIATHALLSLSAAPPGCPAETFTVNLVNGYAVIRPVGTPVQVTKGWGATSMAYLSDFLEAISMEASLDGGPMILLPDYLWSLGEESGDYYISRWIYHLGILDPGLHTLEVVGTLSQPITDGFDSDDDGQPDLYSGEIWHFTMQIAVY